VAGAPDDLVERLGRFGLDVGIAFQITDDRLDGDGIASIGSEVDAGQRAESLLAEALALVEGLGERAEPLRQLARFAVRRSG
jgi:hypothetical protein